jgi:hypothetical protein
MLRPWRRALAPSAAPDRSSVSNLGPRRAHGGCGRSRLQPLPDWAQRGATLDRSRDPFAAWAIGLLAERRPRVRPISSSRPGGTTRPAARPAPRPSTRYRFAPTRPPGMSPCARPGRGPAAAAQRQSVRSALLEAAHPLGCGRPVRRLVDPAACLLAGMPRHGRCAVCELQDTTSKLRLECGGSTGKWKG